MLQLANLYRETVGGVMDFGLHGASFLSLFISSPYSLRGVKTINFFL